MEEDKEIRFVARHYRHGRFNVPAAWRRLGIVRPASWWRRYRVAASVAAAAALAASAVIIYNAATRDLPVQDAPQEVQAADMPGDAVRVMDFEDAPLTDVVEAIEQIYGVEVTGLPGSPGDYRLSLHYEGSAAGLIETINEICGTELTVTEK